MKILVYNGNVRDSKLEEIANNVKDTLEKAGYALKNDGLIRILDSVNNAERLAEYEMPIPSWYLGQQFVMNQFSQGGLFEFIDHSHKGVNVANFEYVVDDTELFKGVTAHVIGHWYVNENNMILNKYKRDHTRDIQMMRRYREIRAKLISKYGKEGEKALDNITTKALSMPIFDLYPELSAKVKEEDDYYVLREDKPARRVYDVGEFACQNSTKLNRWEKEICSMTLEAYKALFVGMRVHIMHEGFATYLQKKHAIADNSGEQLALIANVVHPYFPQFPYSFGLHLFEHISKHYTNGREIIETSIRSLDDIEWIATYADTQFVKEELNRLSVEIDVSKLSSELEQILTEIGLKKDKESLTNEEMFRRYILFQLFVNLPPRLYIPPRSIGQNRELHLVQEIYPLVAKLLPINSEKALMESDVIKSIAPIFTLNNSQTKKFVSILCDIWGGPVYLHTINENGERITIKASKSGEKLVEEKGWASLGNS
jgi:spore cortex formation protein SpoVR/YcgB (stage V sporulation)